MAKLPIPTGQIDCIVDRHHVCDSDGVIKADIEKRMTDPKFTPAIKRACLNYAVKRHRRNQNLYHRVVTGNLK